MIGHRTRFRENDDIPLWRGPAAKEKPPFSNGRALIAREIMRSILVLMGVRLLGSGPHTPTQFFSEHRPHPIPGVGFANLHR